MKRNPPFFWIGNNAHFKDLSDIEEEPKISADTETNPETTLHHVTFVDLVESKDGTFSFIPRDGDSTPPPPCQAPSSIAGKSNTTCFYIRNWAIGHLCSFAALLGRYDIKLDGHHSHGLTRLEDTTASVLYLLLPASRLFLWQPLLLARNDGDITWAGIRALLSIARTNVPFLTRDGILKHVLADQITFTQFIAFSEMLREHLRSAACLKDSLKETSESTIDIIPCDGAPPRTHRRSGDPTFIQNLEEADAIDLFNIDSSLGVVPRSKPVGLKEEDLPSDEEAGISRADSYFNKNLSRHTVTIWFQQTQERLRQSEMLQKHANLAVAAYNKRLMTTVLKASLPRVHLPKED